MFRSVGEHTKVAGICTKPGQFSQPCRAAGGRFASASRLLSGRCKKTFEFASKRLKTSKNLAEVAHGEQTHIAAQNILCAATWRASGIESRSEQVISSRLYGATLDYVLKAYPRHRALHPYPSLRPSGD